MTEDQAMTVGLQALAWLVGQDELIDVFLSSTGADLGDLRASAALPETQGAVLDFLMMNDAWITACCDANGWAYELPQRARQALPGGGQMHWT